MADLPIALYVIACLNGSLHGAPHEVCRAVPIRAYVDIPACTAQMGYVAAEWLHGMHEVGIDPRVAGEQCAARKTSDD